jgi:molybdopterin synthase sulfur carrier subunit
MPIQVRIPTPLQKLTKDQAQVTAQGEDILSLFDNLENEYPGIKERIFDETGTLRRFVNIYINDEDIRFLEGDKTQLKDGDEVSIIPAIAGGRG